MIIVLTSMLLTIIICALIAVLSVAVVTKDPAAAKGLYYPLGLVGALIAAGITYLIFWLFNVRPAFSMVLTGLIFGYFGCARVVLNGLLEQKFGTPSKQ